MSRVLTDDEVVERLRGILPEDVVRSALAAGGRVQDPRQFWLVERVWSDGTVQYHLRRKRKMGHQWKGNYRERIAQLPPLDRLEWKTTAVMDREKA